jgi:hypothetical protein
MAAAFTVKDAEGISRMALIKTKQTGLFIGRFTKRGKTYFKAVLQKPDGSFLVPISLSEKNAIVGGKPFSRVLDEKVKASRNPRRKQELGNVKVVADLLESGAEIKDGYVYFSGPESIRIKRLGRRAPSKRARAR